MIGMTFIHSLLNGTGGNIEYPDFGGIILKDFLED